MLSNFFRFVALGTAFAFSGSAHPQSQAELADRINTTLPDNARGQITASSLRGLMQSFNGARGKPNGIAELGPDGRLMPAQGQTTFTVGSFLGPLDAPLASFGALQMKQVSALDKTYAQIKNPNAVMLGVGNQIVFCPELSCLASATSDHQRASLFVSAETQVDGQAEEQTVGVTTTIKTGQVKSWAPSTAFAVGDNVEFHDSRNAVYRAVQSGTSASGGSGPTGTGDFITDGSVRWKWVNAAAINGKVGIYNEVLATTGGGKGWAQANNFEMRPGYVPSFATALELDFTNNSGVDCAIGVASCNNLYLRTYGTNKSTSSINVEGPDTGNAAANFGLYLHGSRLSSDASVQIDTSGLIGIRLGGFVGAGYAQAGIVEQSASPIGIQFAGTYGTAQIKGNGWQVAPDGGLTAANIDLPGGTIYERNPYVPTSSTSPCITGQRSWDQSYEYRCVGTNVWKRVPYAAGSW